LNTRYEAERDLRDYHETATPDREISLGTTTILGIFFALALLCAAVFGFGYSMGRRSAPPAATPVETSNSAEGSSAKPSPGSLANQTSVPTIEKPAANTVQSSTVPLDSQDTQQTTDPAPSEAAVSPRPSPRNEPASPRSEPAAGAATKPVAVTPVSTAPPSPAGSSIVQIAAMSHQEDADVVAADLKRRGYNVAIRRVPQDKLFHVQIGPFANKKEADTMRQRLQTDGYNSAIVK
jgi:DedD protein